MTDTAGPGAPDTDPVRTLVLGLLERIEHFASTVISDRERPDGTSADIGPAIRATVDTVIGEVGEFITNLIAAIIAVLEAISAALDEAIGARGRYAPGRPAGPARPGGGFQPIAVEVEIEEPSLVSTHHTIGIDIGGTSIRAAVIDSRGEILDKVRAQTPPTAPALEKCLDRLVAELRTRWTVDAVGLAVAGFLTPDRSTIRFSPHLPWREVAVAAEMSARIGLPVSIEHDANAAAIAERRFGAAGGGHNTLVLAIGTGIGAGMLLEGDIYRGSFGVAPEFGHLCVVPGGRPCSCGKLGCWERYCSGTALVDTVVELVADGAFRSSQLARETAVDPGSLTGRRVAAAAHDGDPVGVAAVADFARWLGQGLAMIADVFDPDLIVLAGGVGASSGLFLDEAREHYGAMLTGSGHRRLARIRGTQLGEAAGMIGAAAVARADLHRVPAPTAGG